MVNGANLDIATGLERELDWFAQVLEARIHRYLAADRADRLGEEVRAPDLSGDKTPYAQLVRHYELGADERLLVMLGLAPHVRPQVLDPFLLRNAELDRTFTEFGGVQGSHHRGCLPTGETALFLLAGNDLRQRFKAQHYFDPDHVFAAHQILVIRPADPGEPVWSGQLQLQREYLEWLTQGTASLPPFGEEFPAKPIVSREAWDNLVLRPDVMSRLDELLAWFRGGEKLMKDTPFGRRMRPGYRCLFHGQSGTGKTMAAALLAKRADRAILRIDLASTVSKWVGETSRNLARVFDRAEDQNWVLFFDEADALFGKRTQLKDAHDRYANQEVSYLLQRMDEFDGTMILATNLRDNLDTAFTRRFDSIVFFPMPGRQERLQIWSNAIDGSFKLAPAVDLPEIATRYELTGGAIMNVVRYAALMAMDQERAVIDWPYLERGIHQELSKERRSQLS